MQEAAAAVALREHIQILFATGSAIGLSDRDLLERYLSHERDSAEAAFSALVERHGPMVLRVCNQALSDRHAADDAFQATFLVLLQHARSIRKHDSMESWLFGVACRAAARIRMLEARRKRYELRRALHQPSDQAGSLSETPDPWPELHAEIARLPEKYRTPIVLCYFEGLTHDQAAAQLGWPVGTVKTRLARARDQLRWRLRGRTWAPTRLSRSSTCIRRISSAFPGSCSMRPLKRPPAFSPARAPSRPTLFPFWRLPGEFRKP